MVKTLVEENGGSISVTSARGIGTTFTLCLPIALHENKTSPWKRPFPLRSVPKQRLSVLIADDDPEVRHTLISVLTSHGHQAVAIPNLHSLRNELSRTDTPVDILLLDDGMAEYPLEDLLKMTKNLHPETKVLITSGDPAAAKHVSPNRSTCLFLAKPFSLNDFYAAVESTDQVTE
jgi:DNA-binding NtrC family response regulator